MGSPVREAVPPGAVKPEVRLPVVKMVVARRASVRVVGLLLAWVLPVKPSSTHPSSRRPIRW